MSTSTASTPIAIPPLRAADTGVAAVVTSVAPLLWGMTYIVTTELLPPGRPLLAATVRALSAGVILAAFAPRRPRGRWWVKAAVLGVLNIGAFFALLFVAAYRLPGGVAATLGSIQPLIAAGLAVAVLRERLRTSVVLSGLLGVAGVALVVLRPDATLDGVGVLAGLAGAASMATGTVLTKRWGQPVPVAAFTSWQLVAGGLGLLLLTPIVEGVPTDLTSQNVAGFGWFALSTAAAYLVWFRGIGALPVARVSLLALLSPVVAALVGWAVLEQGLTALQLLGALLVLIAITLGNDGLFGYVTRRRMCRSGRTGRNKAKRVAVLGADDPIGQGSWSCGRPEPLEPEAVRDDETRSTTPWLLRRSPDRGDRSQRAGVRRRCRRNAHNESAPDRRERPS